MNREALERALTSPWRVVRWFLLTRPIRFTRFGMWYILFALAVGAAAINTGNNLLYLVLGVLLGSIVVSGILSDSSLWQIETRWFPAGTLYAGQPAVFEAQLEKGRFSGFGVTVESTWRNVEVSRQPHFFYWLASDSTEKFKVPMTPARRGWLALQKLRYSTRFPFGLFEKFHLEERDERWIVFPSTRRIPLASLSAASAGSAARQNVHAGNGSVPFDLRHFREGDSARRIHWRSSAKRQRLLVHEMEDDSGAGSWLAVPAWPSNLSEERMEDFIAFIASAAFTLVETGRPVGLLTPDLRLPPAHSRPHLQRILRYLALVVPASAAPLSDMILRKTDRLIDMPDAWRRHGA